MGQLHLQYPRHAVTADDLANGYFVPLTAWDATGGTAAKQSYTITGDEVDLLVRKPSLSATYTGAKLVDIDSSGFASVGDTITYTAVVTNNGNVRLTGVTVAGQDPFDLAVNESKTFTTVYTLTAADVAANKVVRGLVVTAKNGTKPAGVSVSADPVAACSDKLCGQAPPMDNLIPQDQISISSVSSEELTGEPAPSGPVAALLDGNVNSYWHTKWTSGNDTFPHSVVFDLGKSYSVTGFEYTQRQSGSNGKIKDYEIYVSDSAANFGSKVSSGSFADVKAPQRIVITGNKAGRYVKLVGLNSIAGNAFGGGAEVNIGGLPVVAGAATVSASPGTVEAGKDISITLGGFPANTAVTLSLDGGISLGSATTDATGATTKTVTVPAGTAAKSYTLSATAGAQTATAALVVTASAPILGATIKGSRGDAGRDLAANPYAVGDQLPYNFAVTSTSPVTTAVYPTSGELTGFNIDGTPNCRFKVLSAGAGYNCASAKRVITADDVANGFFQPVTQWAVEAAGSTTVNYTITGDEVDVLVRKPSLAVTVGAGVFEDKDKDGFAGVGDVVTFPVTVKNEGNVALTGVSVPGVDGVAATLAAGASTNGAIKHTVVAADLAESEVDGPAVAAAAKNGGTPVSKTATGTAFDLTLAPEPSASPTPTATVAPTTAPTVGPTMEPTVAPTASPTVEPTATTEPTATQEPTASPTASGDSKPSAVVGGGSVIVGGELTVTGKNFKPGTAATFTLHSKPVVLGTAVVGADGTVSLTAKVPVGIPAGAHTVIITGTDANGMAVQARIAMEIAAAVNTAGATTPGATNGATTATSAGGAGATAPAAQAAGNLASTGFNGLVLAVGAGMLLLLGGLIVARQARTRGTRH